MNAYKKESDISYALGSFPTLELIKNRPDLVKQIILSSELRQNEAKSLVKDFCHNHKIPCDINDKLLKQLSSKENCYLAGAFRKDLHKLSSSDHHIVLVSPENMGNAGTIMRTILGFGYKNLAIIRPAIDIFDPKTVRASMGAIFGLNIEYFDTFSAYQKAYPANEIYTFMLKGRTPLKSIKPDNQKAYSLVFGSESSGLPDEYLSKGTSVIIEQSKAIDSLNLTIAVAIASYTLSVGI